MEPLISSLSQLIIDVQQPVVNNTQEDDLASSIESVLPVEHLQLWQAKQPVNMLTYLPQYCNKGWQVWYIIVSYNFALLNSRRGIAKFR